MTILKIMLPSVNQVSVVQSGSRRFVNTDSLTLKKDDADATLGVEQELE